MNCSLTLGLKGVVPHYGNDFLSNLLEVNLKAYYDWALLNIGAWTEINIADSGYYGANFSQLRPVSDPNYTDGQVWEAFRKDWVYEQNIDYIDTTGGINNPSLNTGALVNGVLNTGYHVDYPNGQIIFDSAVSTSATVQTNFTFRDVQIYRADEAPWWREIQYYSMRPDSTLFSQIASGDWSIFAQNRVQLPAIVIEISPRGGHQGYQLGSETQYAHRDVTFHVIAEDNWSRNQLLDIISLQVDRKIWMFDSNQINTNEAYPLNYQGSIANNNSYTGFVSATGYRYKILEMKDSSIRQLSSPHPRLHLVDINAGFDVLV